MRPAAALLAVVACVLFAAYVEALPPSWLNGTLPW